jgi:hypothetical protein
VSRAASRAASVRGWFLAFPELLRARGQVLAPPLLITALLIPTLIWIFKDQRVWPWDQSHYAEIALRIAQASEQGFVAWLAGFIDIPIVRAPLLSWLGSLTVPLEGPLGSVERALGLVNVFATATTLGLLYSTLRRLGASLANALAGVLVCAGSTMLLGLTHNFLVEPLQATGVAAMMRAAIEADRMSFLRLAACLIAAATVAMLAKVSSAGFVVPFVVYAAAARYLTRREPRQSVEPSDYFLALFAVLFASVATYWYVAHWPKIIAFAILATNSDIALHYGSSLPLIQKMEFWSRTLSLSVAPFYLVVPPTFILSIVAITGEALRLLRLKWREREPEIVKSGLLLAFCVLGTILAALVTYSSQLNQAGRFATPLIPLVAVLCGWSLSWFASTWLTAIALLVLATNTMVMNANMLGLTRFAGWSMKYLTTPPHRNAGQKKALMQAVRLACNHALPSRVVLVGVESPQLNANSASFYSLKRPQTRGKCAFTNLGYPPVTTLDAAIARLRQTRAKYFITFRNDLLPASGEGDWLNVVTKPIAEWVAGNPDFRRLSKPDDAIQVYRRLK